MPVFIIFFCWRRTTGGESMAEKCFMEISFVALCAAFDTKG